MPKLHLHYRGRDRGAYLQRMGYRQLDAKPDAGQHDPPQYESTDAYSGRMRGYLLFYGALLQSGRLREGLAAAWQYLARFGAC